MRVLIAEDDKLVRRGLVTQMPWEKYGMTVVGEAANGASALKLIEHAPVDLLLCDMQMPFMSGMELMRIVRQRHPHIAFAVLTMHQDFEYIQEALRLGAVDYIAKVELERDSFDKVLARLSERMSVSLNKRHNKAKTNEFATVLFCRRMIDLPAADLCEAMGLHEVISPLSWMWIAGSLGEARDIAQLYMKQEKKTGTLLIISGVEDLDHQSLINILQYYQQSGLFYNSPKPFSYLTKSIDELKKEAVRTDTAGGDDIRLRWLFPNWVFLGDVLEKLLADTRSLYIPPIKLRSYVEQAIEDLYMLSRYKSANPHAVLQELYCWEQFETFIRDFAGSFQHKEIFSKEIVDCICYSTHTIGEELNNQLSAEDVAQMVNMSRSYFFHCFKSLLGVNFNEYVRIVKINKAKSYLLGTAKSLSCIARDVGYSDEKYFSRVFKEVVGVLPKDYRANKGGMEL